ncbi:MAG: hypothetical protein GY759_05095 [Chloroflexi bacterium]|nr:hypothetical protein [Chloroflexota bacterium]
MAEMMTAITLFVTRKTCKPVGRDKRRLPESARSTGLPAYRSTDSPST